MGSRSGESRDKANEGIPARSYPTPFPRIRETAVDDDSFHSSPASSVRDIPHSRRLSNRIMDLRQAGGVNSIDRFARSWTRAATFHEITPTPQSFFVVPDDNSVLSHSDGSEDPEAGSEPSQIFLPGTSAPTSFLRDFDPQTELRIQQVRDETLFLDSVGPSSFSTSYGTTYDSVRERRRPSIARRPSDGSGSAIDLTAEEREPMLIKQAEDGGVKIVGQSTLPQTIFNSVNVLIGIGLLSLPLAFRYCGWVVGLSFFLVAVLVTRYTALVLSKCLDVDGSMITFADVAYVAFGNKARVAISVLFTIELVAACVALVVLFGDSLDALFPGSGVLPWKILCGALLIPLGFLPLRLLSFTSVLGILSCLGITLSVFMAGLSKQHGPGSLLDPAKTYAWPDHWATVFLGFGLLMSPWGGHTVFPNIYRDMRHPYRYRTGVNITYTFTFLLDLSMGMIGLLMFGDNVRDEITSNILLTPGYPPIIGLTIIVCIATIPLTKVPLNARPVLSVLEELLGLQPINDPVDSDQPSEHDSDAATKTWFRKTARAVLNVATTVSFVAISIVFPSFDRIMALLGSVCCFTICIILPLMFHLKLFGNELSRREAALNWVGIIVSTVLAVLSTGAALWPHDVGRGK